jgi:hypothetical protein
MDHRAIAEAGLERRAGLALDDRDAMAEAAHIMGGGNAEGASAENNTVHAKPCLLMAWRRSPP